LVGPGGEKDVGESGDCGSLSCRAGGKQLNPHERYGPVLQGRLQEEGWKKLQAKKHGQKLKKGTTGVVASLVEWGKDRHSKRRVVPDASKKRGCQLFSAT